MENNLGLTKKIHINQHNIRHNHKHPEDIREVITVKTYKNNHKANTVEILGLSKLVYSPDKPLSCGARVWIETTAPVKLNDKELV